MICIPDRRLPPYRRANRGRSRLEVNTMIKHLPLLLFGLSSVAFAADWPGKDERDAAAKTLDVGESAPEWLVRSETYAFGNDPKIWEALAAAKVSFITHCPINREYFQ